MLSLMATVLPARRPFCGEIEEEEEEEEEDAGLMTVLGGVNT